MEVHRSRFIEYLPPEILDISIRGDLCLVLFQDSSIRFYTLPGWSQLMEIPGNTAWSLRKVLWLSDSSILAVGLSGGVLVWSLSSLVPCVVSTAAGSGIWDIDRNSSQQFAIGCEDGSVKFFSYSEEEVDVWGYTSRVKGKMLAVKWAGANTVFSGCSDGGIYKWKVDGTMLHRINNKHAVWTLEINSHNELITGDADGAVSVWDVRSCTLLQTFKEHEGDILALAVEDNHIYATGADSRVIKLTRHKNSWILQGKCRGQSHDIRALAKYKDLLLSGGVTSDVCIYPEDLFESEGDMSYSSGVARYNRKNIRHISMIPSSSPITIAVRASLFRILVNQRTQLDVWEVDKQNDIVNRIAVIKPKGKYLIACSGISGNGEWVAYSTLRHFKLYKYSSDGPTMEPVDTDVEPCSVMSWRGEVLYTGHTALYSYNTRTATSKKIYEFASVIRMIHTYKNVCAVVGVDNEVSIFKKDNFYCKLPQLPCTINALTFTIKSVYLITEDNKLHGFMLKNQEPDDYIKQFGSQIPKNFLNEVNRCTGLSYQDRKLILNTLYSYTIIDLTKKPPKKCEIYPRNIFSDHKSTWYGVLSTHPLHSSRTVPSDVKVKDFKNFAINKRYGPILGMFVKKNDLFVCELPWDEVLEQKPQPLITHKYGT